MLNKAATISLATFFAHVTTWEGHIFHKPAEWLKERLPEGLQKPLFNCPICMTPYWGTLMLLMLKGDRRGLARAVVTIAAAAGISSILLILSKAHSVLLLVEEEKEMGRPEAKDQEGLNMLRQFFGQEPTPELMGKLSESLEAFKRELKTDDADRVV